MEVMEVLFRRAQDPARESPRRPIARNITFHQTQFNFGYEPSVSESPSYTKEGIPGETDDAPSDINHGLRGLIDRPLTCPLLLPGSRGTGPGTGTGTCVCYCSGQRGGSFCGRHHNRWVSGAKRNEITN